MHFANQAYRRPDQAFTPHLLIFFGVGCVAALKVAGASFGQWEISVIWGLGVAMAIYLTAGVSGAHLNPAVTIALWLFACFDKRKPPDVDVFR